MTIFTNSVLSRRKSLWRFLAGVGVVLALCAGSAGPAAAQEFEPFDFLILADEELCVPMRLLKQYKETTGIRTEVVDWRHVDADYAGRGADVQERIKHFIADCERQYGIRYVLLAGSADRFPVRYVSTDLVYDTSDRCFINTDLYYADLYDEDGNFCDWDANGNGWFGEMDAGPTWDAVNVDNADMIPDVAVGRLPVSTAEDAATYVRKVIDYERESFGADWERRILLSATTDPMWSVCTLMEPIGQFVLTQYEPVHLHQTGNPCRVTAPLSGSNIVNVLNEGVGFVAYAGHGAPHGWAIPGDWLNNTDVDGLENAGRLPVVFASACSTAKYAPAAPYDRYTDIHGTVHTGTHNGEVIGGMPVQPAPLQAEGVDSMAGRFLVGGDHGAVAYVGSTAISQTSLNTLMDLFFRSHNNNMLSSAAPENRMYLGDMWRIMTRNYYHLEEFVENPGDHSRHLLRRIMQPWNCHLFGDPTLRIGGIPDGMPSPDEELDFDYGPAVTPPADTRFLPQSLAVFSDWHTRIYVEDEENIGYLMDENLDVLARWPNESPEPGVTRKVSCSAAGDLTGDGRFEIVTLGTLRDAGGTYWTFVMACQQNGELVWERLCPRGDAGSPDQVCLGDVDGDGRQDVVIFSGDPPAVLAFNRQGEPIGEPISIPTDHDMFKFKCALGDVDGDDRDEVVAIDMGECVSIVHADTGEITRLCPPDSAENTWFSDAVPVLADLDEDGREEIICTTVDDDTGEAFVFIHQWSEFRWDRPMENPFRAWPVPGGGWVSSPSLADLDLDGTPEIVVLSKAGFLFAWNAAGELLYTDTDDKGRFLGDVRNGFYYNYQPILAGTDAREGVELLHLQSEGRRPDLTYRLGSFRAGLLGEGEIALPWAARLWLSDVLPIGVSDSYVSRLAALDLDADAAVDVVVALPEAIQVLNGSSRRVDIQWGMPDGDPQHTRNYEKSHHALPVDLDLMPVDVVWEEWDPFAPVLSGKWVLWDAVAGKLPEWWFKIMKEKPIAKNAVYFGNAAIGDYDAGKERVLLRRTTQPIEISKEAQLRFKSWEHTEGSAKKDTRKVYMHHEKYGRVLLHQCLNTQKTWTDVSIDLEKFAGQKLAFEFEFDSVDGLANTYTGWFVDDVKIESQSAPEPAIKK